MEKLMSILLNVVTFGFYGFVNRGTHEYMTKNCTSRYKYTLYKKWKQDFDKIEWEVDKYFSESLFDHPTESQCHASILEISGNGYILSTWGYFKAQRDIKRKIKELKSWT